MTLLGFSLRIWTITALMTATLYSGQVVAGNIYVFKNQEGDTLLTNRKVADKGYKQVKVTYYPDTNVHRYQNWGKSEAAVLPSYSKNRHAFDGIIAQAAQHFGVSSGLIKAVMHTESGFNINARSPVGAQGLMQLMPATARRFGVHNAYDPHQNIHGGTQYLSWLLKRFKGDLSLALAAYNAGEGNVDKYKGIPPFRETQDYVKRVLSRYHNLYASNTIQASTASTPSSAVPVVVSSSVQAPPSTATASSNSITTEVAPARKIIQLADGKFTDAPIGHTYANEYATVRANIYLSND